jgi:hypothetical protein
MKIERDGLEGTPLKMWSCGWWVTGVFPVGSRFCALSSRCAPLSDTVGLSFSSIVHATDPMIEIDKPA